MARYSAAWSIDHSRSNLLGVSCSIVLPFCEWYRADLCGGLSSGARSSGRHHCGRGLVEVEVALAGELPGGDELEPDGDVEVVIEELADVRVRRQAGRVGAVA